MVQSKNQSVEPEPAVLTIEEMRKAVPRIERRLNEVREFDPDEVNPDDPWNDVSGIIASIEDALVRTYGYNSIEYLRYNGASDFSWPVYLGNDTPIHEINISLHRCRKRSISLLEQSLASLQEQIDEASDLPDIFNDVKAESSITNRKIFLVHGRDNGAREAVARYLEKLDFEPVILHEKANEGLTIIEKFETHSDVGFAVVLLTPDDLGGLNEVHPSLLPRARQNVLLELGYFTGKLGRDRVCALRTGELEIPSDIVGIAWVPFNILSSDWHVALAKELLAAGYTVDWNKIMGG